MATRTISNAGGDWASTGTWVEGIVPTAADNVAATATSGSVTITSLSPVCRSADFTNFAGNLGFSAVSKLSVGDASGGSFITTTAMTITRSTGILAFVSTSNNGGAGWTIVNASNGLPALVFDGVGGKWILSDDVIVAGSITLTNGILNLGSGVSAQCTNFTSSNSNVRTLSLAAGADLFVQSTGGTFDASTSTNFTVSMTDTSRILINAYNGASGHFYGGGISTYGRVDVPNGDITGANTFSALYCDYPGGNTGRVVTLPSGVTNTVTSNLVWSSGTAVTNFAYRLSVVSSSPGTAATISASSSVRVDADYVSIQDSTATGGATFHATHAVNALGNTGWTFDLFSPLTNPVGSTDSSSQVEAATRLIGDVGGITDSISVTFVSSPVIDTVGLVDAISSVIGIGASITDTVGVTDATSSSLPRNVTDTIGILHGGGTIYPAVTAFPSTTVYPDGEPSLQAVATSVRSSVDPLGLSDSVVVVRTSARSVTDPVGLVDAASSSTTKALTDAVGLTDPTPSTTITQTGLAVTDTVGVIDVVSSSVFTSPIITVSITDSVGVIDATVATAPDPLAGNAGFLVLLSGRPSYIALINGAERPTYQHDLVVMVDSRALVDV